MIALLTIVLVGFILGMRHATDPDHVIAVTTIVSRQRSMLHASLIGILWGIGHTITIFVIGTAIIVFSVVIPARVGLSMELSVGLMLILLGALNLSGVMRRINERFAPLEKGDRLDSVADLPEAQIMRESENDATTSSVWFGRVFRTMGLFQTLRPLLVGIVHGLAGSAAVALLVLTTIRNPWWALLYLLIFGIGTIAGMMLITVALALPFSFAGHRFAWLNRGLVVGSGVLSLFFGIFVCYNVAFVDGLFTRHPRWNPS